MNKKINLISAEVLIGEFLQDYNMTSSDFISRLNRHIVRAIELMDIDTYYTRCVKAFTTEECRTIIPCSAKFMEAIVLDVSGSPFFLDLTSSGFRLLTTDNLTGTSGVYGYVDGMYLNLKDFDGRGFFLYKSLPTNKRGYVMLPDDAYVMEATLNFIVAKLGLSGYKHKVIKREEAEAKWQVLYPRARNSVNFPTPEDMEEFTYMNASPLYNNIDRIGGEDLANLAPNISLLDAYPSSINKFYSFEALAEAFGVDEWSSTEL